MVVLAMLAAAAIVAGAASASVAGTTSVEDPDDVETNAEVVRLKADNAQRAVILKTTFAECDGSARCPEIADSVYYLKWSKGMCRHSPHTSGIQGLVECRRGTGNWEITNILGCATSSRGERYERVRIPRSGCLPRFVPNRLRFRAEVQGFGIAPGDPNEWDRTAWTSAVGRG